MIRDNTRDERETIYGEVIAVNYFIPAKNKEAIAIMDEAFLSLEADNVSCDCDD